MLLIVLVSIALFGSYAGLRYAELPVVANTCVYKVTTTTLTVNHMFDASQVVSNSGCARSDELLEITVSFPIYVIGITCWLGWWFLIFFLGSGLTALPIDYIN